MSRFTTVILFCAALLVSAGLLVVGCGGGGGGGGTTSSGKAGYEVDWTDGANHIWGTICGGQDQPFTLNFTSGEGISGTFAFSPDNARHDGSGTVRETGSKSGMPAGSSLTYSGEGGYAFMADNTLYFLISEQKATLTLPVVGAQVSTVNGISNTLPLLPTSKCN